MRGVALGGRLRLEALAHLLLRNWVNETVRRLVRCIVLARDVLTVLLLFALLLLQVLLLDSLVVGSLSLGACIFHLRLLLFLLFISLTRLELEGLCRRLQLATFTWTWTARRWLLFLLRKHLLLLLLFSVLLILQFLTHNFLQLHFLSLVNDGYDFGYLLNG